VSVLVQCTSPFVDRRDLAAAIAKVRDGKHDVVLSVSQSDSFHWRLAEGRAEPVDHDMRARPRRQDREPQFRESGAFYAFRTAGFLESGVRFFGSVGIQVVDKRWAVEVDDAFDLDLARALSRMRGGTVTGAASIRALVTDFDGVHTDDSAIVNEAGFESVRVSRADGLGLQLLREAGLPILVLSKESNPVVTARAKKLGVETMQGVDDKAAALSAWIQAHGLNPSGVMYVGNDVNDLPAMRVVGWPAAVADARPMVLEAARVVLSRPGGHGAVREACDIILAALNEAQPDA
jgi:N-acylneuraminate cytidylyltransferase